MCILITGRYGLVGDSIANFTRPGGWNLVIRYRERGSSKRKVKVAQKLPQIRGHLAIFIRRQRIYRYLPS